MLPAALPLNAFCPSPALLKHISTGPAYSKHSYVHFQVGEEGQLMTCWTAKYFLSYVGFLFVFFPHATQFRRNPNIDLRN